MLKNSMARLIPIPPVGLGLTKNMCTLCVKLYKKIHEKKLNEEIVECILIKQKYARNEYISTTFRCESTILVSYQYRYGFPTRFCIKLIFLD